MHKKKKILIIGGGLVGSLAAIYLAKRGYNIDVYEKRSDYRKVGALGGRSINLALSDRGWKSLEEVGITENIRQISIPMKGRMIHDLEGKQQFLPYGKENQAIYSVSRGQLNIEMIRLADHYENVNFHFDWQCEEVDILQNKASFLHLQTQEKRNVEADIIMGSDGAYSALRLAFQKTDRFNYSQQYLEHSYKELCIPASPHGEFLLDKNALHIWPRHQFMLIALPNIDGSFTCTLFLQQKGSDNSFEALSHEKAIIDFFTNYFPDTIPLMPTLVHDFLHNPTPSLITVRCAPWHQGKHSFLIGDAAHAVVPFYGQGMNCGFEDCRILNSFLDLYEDDWEKTLQEYQKERIPNANAIADLALQNFVEMRDKVADPAFVLRKKIENRIHQAFPEHWIPLYAMVTFSPHLPYQEALRIGNIQEEIMNEVMKSPTIQTEWETMPIEPLIQRLKTK